MSNKEIATEKRLRVRLYLSLLSYTVVGYTHIGFEDAQEELQRVANAE